MFENRQIAAIDLNRLRRYRALEFRQPVTQGKHSVKRSLYKALHKRLSLVLRTFSNFSYRPFLNISDLLYEVYRPSAEDGVPRQPSSLLSADMASKFNPDVTCGLASEK